MRLLILFFSFCTIVSGSLRAALTSVVELQQQDITRLVPYNAELKGGVKIFMPEEPFKSFWIENWDQPQQSIGWSVSADQDPYRIAALVSADKLQPGEEAVLEVSNGLSKATCTVTGTGWQRLWFDKELAFTKGNSNLQIQILKPGESSGFELKLYSLEVVKPAVYTRLMAEAKALRSDTRWMGDIKYGFFFHWNSKSMPRRGEPKKYADAVADFDVDQFASMVNDCGAKLIFFTTSWAEYYFPAPIKAIDDIIPGRTASRDLVADLSDALGKYGIKLILYYHIGHGDKEWWDKQECSRNNSGKLFTNLEKVMGEVSQRYGKKLAGLWMDDGMGYYPNGAPFEKITRAAKSGNKNLVICYNPWVFPKFTEFQDYYAGEVGLSVESAGHENPYLPIGGNGVFTGGYQEGLQATYTGILEPGDWTHLVKNEDIGPPLLSDTELTQIIKESNKRKNLPMINVQVYQDGTISPQTYTLLKSVKKALDVK